jgi:hypothetical protein
VAKDQLNAGGTGLRACEPFIIEINTIKEISGIFSQP